MKRTLKVPKRIAGVKIPNTMRRGSVADFINSSGGRILIAGALLMAARSLAASQLDPESRAGRAVNHPIDAARDLASGAVAAVTANGAGESHLARAFREGLSAFRNAFTDLDGSATADVAQSTEEELGVEVDSRGKKSRRPGVNEENGLLSH